MRARPYTRHVIPRTWPAAGLGLESGSIRHLKGDAGGRSLEKLRTAARVMEEVLEVTARLDGRLRSELVTGLSMQPVHTRIFGGTGEQVRAVRGFVHDALAGHPASGDVILAASELAANAVLHSASGHAGGMFAVHVTEIAPSCVGLIVTDQGGADWPQLRPAGLGAESGHGLQVVASVACWLAATGGQHATRSVIAVMQAGPGEPAVAVSMTANPPEANPPKWWRFGRGASQAPGR